MDLEVRKIDFSYEGKKILDGIDLFAGRALIGILGPNGSGKTTLLRNVDGLLKPERGTILVDGKEIATFSAKDLAKKIGMVPQDNPTEFEFSALDVVLMGRNPYLKRFQLEGEEEIEIAKKYMKLTNCWYFAHKPITELSGGEVRRVIIARALTQEPRILLLDEPTAHLDLNYQIEIMDLVRRLSRDRVVIAALHDLNLAARYCDRLLLLNKGKVAFQGKVEEVLTRENIKEVFGVDVLVKKGETIDSYTFTPIKKEEKKRNARIHVICGGGSGGGVMVKLFSMGFEVTAGVLNIFDTDYQTAKQLEIEAIGELPFSKIGDEAHEVNLKMVKRASAVILTNFPVGPGNMRNLEAAESGLEHEIPLIVIETTPLEQKDYTGELKDRWHDLKKDGAIFVSSIEEAMEKLEGVVGGKEVSS
jgi:iron complex transport system ATP-binding protein